MDLSIFNNRKLLKLLKDNDVSVLSLFGSAARNEDNDQSDADLLIKFSKTKSLLAFIRLEREISRLRYEKI